MNHGTYANVIIDISHEKVDRPFQYRIPDSLKEKLAVGMCVQIPFGTGNRKRKGYVIEITDKNIRSFESTAKKNGIDFALKKDNSEKPPRYLVFFKGRDADVLTMAFNEYSQKILRQKEKPSIRQAIRKLAEIVKSQHKDREKIKDRSIER